MGIKDRMYELTEVSEVDEFLEKYPTGAFFKAGSCHKTMQGFGYVEQALNPYDQIHLGFVRVIQSRPVSNYIAELMQIVHQSPQLILYVDKKPVYDVDNWDINVEVVNEALEKHFGPANSSHSVAPKANQAEVKPYVELLQKLLSGSLSEKDFEYHWLTTFQMDATPRSTEQFELLNSLFGDVDQALANKYLLNTQKDAAHTSLKERAANLYQLLQK